MAVDCEPVYVSCFECKLCVSHSIVVLGEVYVGIYTDADRIVDLVHAVAGKKSHAGRRDNVTAGRANSARHEMVCMGRRQCEMRRKGGVQGSMVRQRACVQRGPCSRCRRQNGQGGQGGSAGRRAPGAAPAGSARPLRTCGHPRTPPPGIFSAPAPAPAARRQRRLGTQGRRQRASAGIAPKRPRLLPALACNAPAVLSNLINCTNRRFVGQRAFRPPAMQPLGTGMVPADARCGRACLFSWLRTAAVQACVSTSRACR